MVAAAVACRDILRTEFSGPLAWVALALAHLHAIASVAGSSGYMHMLASHPRYALTPVAAGEPLALGISTGIGLVAVGVMFAAVALEVHIVERWIAAARARRADPLPRSRKTSVLALLPEFCLTALAAVAAGVPLMVSPGIRVYVRMLGRGAPDGVADALGICAFLAGVALLYLLVRTAGVKDGDTLMAAWAKRRDMCRWMRA